METVINAGRCGKSSSQARQIEGKGFNMIKKICRFIRENGESFSNIAYFVNKLRYFCER